MNNQLALSSDPPFVDKANNGVVEGTKMAII